MPLSHYTIAHAKAGAKPYKLRDSSALYLSVAPTGAKLWRMNYRYLDRQKTLHFGAWPAVGLAEAREKRDAARKQLAAGLDPAAEKKVARVTRKVTCANTFKAVAEEWVEKNVREGRAKVTLDKIRWLLGMAYPMIGARPIAEITPQEVLAVLRKVEAAGHFESARRMRSVLSRVFRYGVATVRCDRDVAADLRGAITTPKVRHFAAVTDPREVGALLLAIDEYSGRAVTRMAMRLSAHVLLRPGELRQAEWADVDWEATTWSIPAERMKMRRPHRVPLSRQVIAMLTELKNVTGDGQLMFPCQGRTLNPMSENTVNQALRRMGYTQNQMTAHGFRAMAATLLNETGLWHPDAIERQLAHVDANQVRRAYARGEYWDERVRMMQSWSDDLDRFRSDMLRKRSENSATTEPYQARSAAQ